MAATLILSTHLSCSDLLSAYSGSVCCLLCSFAACCYFMESLVQMLLNRLPSTYFGCLKLDDVIFVAIYIYNQKPMLLSYVLNKVKVKKDPNLCCSHYICYTVQHSDNIQLMIRIFMTKYWRSGH